MGHYLMYEKHPLVLGFFLALLIISEIMFVPPAWPRLSNVHHFILPVIVALPYLFIYTTVTSDSSIITLENHRMHMRYYPYDRVLYQPGNMCRTCHFLKPARSKHCSICRACVAKSDHHCIWINNCLGRGNYGYFVALLLVLSILLTYGGYLGHMLLTQTLQETPLRRSQGMASRSHWSVGKNWSVYFQLWGWAITKDVRVGSVAMLTIMIAPLAWGLLLYHVYLIWAGMTTNESLKWADWKDDIADGIVFKGRRSLNTAGSGSIDPEVEPNVAWPIESDQILVRTETGLPPNTGESSMGAKATFASNADHIPHEFNWVSVKELQEVNNIYDLGFWDNFRDIIRNK
ncbi:MAG: palmitoyltransferase swf1 [Pleopsidium flavum]|nr:MAG: palmitoyltransferase swf1 [Pleopsidium flavum]